MMRAINRTIQTNNFTQTSNLAIQNLNDSNITTTEILIAVGIGLILGIVIFIIMDWLIDR